MLKFDRTLCIHELVAVRAAEAPNSCALRCGNRQVSYGELNTRADSLANWLQQRGVGPEKFVGLTMPRSVEAVIGVLGILKAGGAYVYLDPSYPSERLRIMADDCQPLLVLNSVDEAEGGGPLASEVTLDHAAYLIYTSGSTGRPKGTIEVHRSLTARLASAPLPDIQEGDVCALNSSLSFGISASRLFLPLAHGLTVLILAENTVQDVRRFVRELAKFGVTSAFMVPALLRQVVAIMAADEMPLPKLRAVTVSGGVLTRELVEAYFRVLPDALLVNNYGSTEIGTSAATKVYTKTTDKQRITIGKPAANTQIFIVDKAMRLAPRGEEGELCVEAPHLARGYLNLPEATKECFPDSPAGVRWYRTGDRGRLLPSGEIELLGRLDQQVKIRGFRVELGEIEAVLLRHPAIKEVFVCATDAGGEKRLIAYFCLETGVECDAAVLRRLVANSLPAHMVPSHFHLIEELPHTDAGKIDQPALETLAAEPARSRESAGEMTALERELAALWQDILGRRIIRDSNFIDLGGDSLQAIQLQLRIENAYGVTVSLATFLDETFAGIVEEIQQQRRALLVGSLSGAPK
jgi:amino acid adenylation domain-containing protein